MVWEVPWKDRAHVSVRKCKGVGVWDWDGRTMYMLWVCVLLSSSLFFLFFSPSLLIFFSLLLRSMCSMHVIVHVSHMCRCMGTLVNGDMGVRDMAACNLGV